MVAQTEADARLLGQLEACLLDLQEVFQYDAVEVLADFDGVFVEHVARL